MTANISLLLGIALWVNVGTCNACRSYRRVSVVSPQSAEVAVTVPVHRVVMNELTFRKIKLGMSRKEVEAVLGKAGDYATKPVVIGTKLIMSWRGDDGEINEFEIVRGVNPPFPTDGEITSARGPLSLRWKGDDGIITATFNEDRAVVLSFQELVGARKGTGSELLKYLRSPGR